MSYKPDGRLPICPLPLRDYDGHNVNVKEIGMSMQSEGKDAKGRNYHQTTKNGTGSAASVGTGGTGDIGRMSGDVDAGTPGNAREGGVGNEQSDARTDDWLTSGTEQEREQGFRPSDPESMKTGMEGIGKLNSSKSGNRQ
jgi:hypothetical protein